MLVFECFLLNALVKMLAGATVKFVLMEFITKLILSKNNSFFLNKQPAKTAYPSI